MTLPSKLAHELKAVGLATLYFGCFLAFLLIIKKLLLAEYQVEFGVVSTALISALILSKVVLILEHVPLGRWGRNQPAWVNVVLRTMLYVLGVFVVLLLEKAFEGRHEYGGFWSSLGTVFEHVDIYHVWVNLLVVSVALLGYNILSVINRHLGEAGLFRMMTTPLPQEQEGG